MTAPGPVTEPTPSPPAVDLHRHARGFVPQPFRAAWRALTPRAPDESSLQALPDLGIGAAVVSAVGDGVVTRTYVGRSPWAAVEAQLVGVEREAAAAGVVVARSLDDVTRASASGRPAVLLGVEGADALGPDEPAALERVAAWADRGVRLVGLVHLADNALGSTSLPWQRYAGPLPVRRRARPGLTPLGRRVLARCQDRGVLVDVAHADRRTLLDATAASAAPLVASHTGARAVQDFARYLDDEELRAIAATGGVVGLWPFRHRGTGVRDLGELVAHARHVADLVGPAHLAVGTDANGVPGVLHGWDGDLVPLAAALRTAGFDEPEVAGVLAGNALRVLREAERCGDGATAASSA